MNCPLCNREMDMGVFSPRLTCRYCGVGYATGLEPLKMWIYRSKLVRHVSGNWARWEPVSDGVMVVKDETIA